MAKENYVSLLGIVQGAPIINKEKGKGNYVLKTLRRNGKYDYPMVNVLNVDILNKLDSFKEGDFILVKGIIASNEVKKGVLCPHCNTKNKKEGTITEIIAIDHLNLGPDHILEELQEMSNTVIVLGSLCRDVDFRIMPTKNTPSAQYQVAINRKLHVKQQDKNRTDYIWTNSFGKQAQQDFARLSKGSQVLIQGGIQTRNVMKTIECEKCGQSFTAEDYVAEIVPYSVEYLNNCKFPENGEE